MTPLGPVLDIQRDLLETGCEALGTGIDLQQALNQSLVDGIESQREAQRRILGLQYVTLRRTIRRTDEETPGPTATEDLLRGLDHRAADLQANQEETFDRLVSSLEGTGDTVGAVTSDSLDTVEDLTLDSLDTVEDLTLDSLDTVEAFTDGSLDIVEDITDDSLEVDDVAPLNSLDTPEEQLAMLLTALEPDVLEQLEPGVLDQFGPGGLDILSHPEE